MESEQRSEASCYDITAAEIGYYGVHNITGTSNLAVRLSITEVQFLNNCLGVLSKKGVTLLRGDLIRFPFFHYRFSGPQLIYNGKTLLELEELEDPEVGFFWKLPPCFKHITLYPLDYWKETLVNYAVNFDISPFLKQIKKNIQVKAHKVAIEERERVNKQVNAEMKVVIETVVIEYDFETISGTFDYEEKRYEVSMSQNLGSATAEDRIANFLDLLTFGDRYLFFPFDETKEETIFIRQL